jgi:hypothetical protein
MNKATQEAEIRRVAIPNQPRQKNSQKRIGEIARGVGTEFKPQYCKQNKTKNNEPQRWWCTPVSLLLGKLSREGSWGGNSS